MTALPFPAAVRAAACPADELGDLLRALLVDLSDGVPPARSASLVVVAPQRSRPGARLRPWVSGGQAGHDLDSAQAAAGQGPAFAAATTDELVVSDDVAGDPRWELPAAAATSVVAAALPAAGPARPVLVVRGDGPDLTDPAAVALVAAAVPDLAGAVAVVQARVEAVNLQVALASNRTIGAAIGITMVTRRLAYDDAAALLRTCSNRTNLRLVDLAEQVLLTGEVPADPPVPQAHRPGGR